MYHISVAKLYYKVNYIAEERGTDQIEIFFREKQYDSITDSGLFTLSDATRRVLNAASILSEQNASSLVVSIALQFKLVKKMIHATKKNNYHIVFSKESVIF